MDLPARTRTCLVAVLLAGAVLAALAPGARANEIAAQGVPTSQRIVVHDAAETLRDWCRTDEQGVLWLELPGGARYELVTSAFDPAIANPGDGSFHPFDGRRGARPRSPRSSYPLDGVAADVFILPYPRRAGLSSAAGHGPDPALARRAARCRRTSSTPRWSTSWGTWCSTRRPAGHGHRGVEPLPRPARHRRPDPLQRGRRRTPTGRTRSSRRTSACCSAARWPPRPARSRTPPCALPGEVPGLEDFMLSLAGSPLAVTLGAAPNPSRGAVVFSRGGRPGGRARPVRPGRAPSRLAAPRRRAATASAGAGTAATRRGGASSPAWCSRGPATAAPPRAWSCSPRRARPIVRRAARSRGPNGSETARACSSPKPAKLRAASNSENGRPVMTSEGAVLRVPDLAREPALHLPHVLQAQGLERRRHHDVVARRRRSSGAKRATGSGQRPRQRRPHGVQPGEHERPGPVALEPVGVRADSRSAGAARRRRRSRGGRTSPRAAATARRAAAGWPACRARGCSRRGARTGRRAARPPTPSRPARAAAGPPGLSARAGAAHASSRPASSAASSAGSGAAGRGAGSGERTGGRALRRDAAAAR